MQASLPPRARSSFRRQIREETPPKEESPPTIRLQRLPAVRLLRLRSPQEVRHKWIQRVLPEVIPYQTRKVSPRVPIRTPAKVRLLRILQLYRNQARPPETVPTRVQRVTIRQMSPRLITGTRPSLHRSQHLLQSLLPRRNPHPKRNHPPHPLLRQRLPPPPKAPAGRRRTGKASQLLHQSLLPHLNQRLYKKQPALKLRVRMSKVYFCRR